MPKKILIITDDAGESQKIYYAKHRFAQAGYKPAIAATQKKLLHGVIHDFDPAWSLTSKTVEHLSPLPIL